MYLNESEEYLVRTFTQYGTVTSESVTGRFVDESDSKSVTGVESERNIDFGKRDFVVTAINNSGAFHVGRSKGDIGKEQIWRMYQRRQ